MVRNLDRESGRDVTDPFLVSVSVLLDPDQGLGRRIGTLKGSWEFRRQERKQFPPIRGTECLDSTHKVLYYIFRWSDPRQNGYQWVINNQRRNKKSIEIKKK